MSHLRKVIQALVLLAVALIFQSSPSQAESPATRLLAVGPLVYDPHSIFRQSRVQPILSGWKRLTRLALGWGRLRSPPICQS
jgi:hypothetical protein